MTKQQNIEKIYQFLKNFLWILRKILVSYGGIRGTFQIKLFQKIHKNILTKWQPNAFTNFVKIIIFKNMLQIFSIWNLSEPPSYFNHKVGFFWITEFNWLHDICSQTFVRQHLFANICSPIPLFATPNVPRSPFNYRLHLYR